MSIFIFNPMQDSHCEHMIKKLKQRGIAFKELGSPLENDYALFQGNLYYNGERIEDGHSAYFRSVMAYDPNEMLNQNAERQYTDQLQFSTRSNAISTWLALLAEKGVKVINPPRNNSKYRQLFLLQQEGIPLPKTCITSSVEIARTFISEVGHAVCKPLLGGSFCRRVPLEQLDLISAEPTIFQEEIDGEDIRVNMLNGKMLSAHLIKKAEGVLDYRTDPLYAAGQIQYEEVSLPQEVIEHCKRATEIMDLRFSGIDLRRNAKGDYYFIECNSMPAFLDIELKTGAVITDAIIDDLLEPHEIEEIKKPDAEKGNLIFQPKKKYFRGKTLFDYYHVMNDWAAQTNQSKQNRMIIELNEKQRMEYKRSTGKEARIVEIEVDHVGVAEIVKVISY